ncbi:hypothetical protein AAFF_G00231010 [Aldrovandia affinis]|uniref:Reverse transcriptase n=1 Tax=Aldrovandia affinis TaxID=143900 RepID=A0AAD7REZ7_9TELE|nr:hypothetical protein AAFF_G00231010 [Aldrovandia affinis]
MYTATFQAHLQHLEEVFWQLSRHGLKLQPQKCRLLKREVKYLGHMTATDPECASGCSRRQCVRSCGLFKAGNRKVGGAVRRKTAILRPSKEI